MYYPPIFHFNVSVYATSAFRARRKAATHTAAVLNQLYLLVHHAPPSPPLSVTSASILPRCPPHLNVGGCS
ncbi:hypothetical protein KCP78_21610 [Salmonella enterica subsp. enterica]|nr:hypothetical protein KCP78_21610 [Salmonella enterica subsp. enterica]